MHELNVQPVLPARTGKILLSLAVPLYNEEEVIFLFFEEVIGALERIPNSEFEIVCVNDGRRDQTLAHLIWHASQDPRVRVMDLIRNFGKEGALPAAIDELRGDVIVPFDADLQAPPSVIKTLAEKWRESYDVVMARRNNRGSDSALKRWTALVFYRLHNKLSEIKIPENVGDFRLMSRQVVNSLKCLPETCRFMKGLFAWVGYKTTVVDYTREVRAAGMTKFSGWKLWNLALEGFTSSSTLSLRVWTYVGSLVAVLSICHALWLTIRTLIFGVDLPGYASLATAVLFLGGIQLVGIGVIGKYVGRIYFESKKCPVYLINRGVSYP